jgi:hypothetical protein
MDEAIAFWSAGATGNFALEDQGQALFPSDGGKPVRAGDGTPSFRFAVFSFQAERSRDRLNRESLATDDRG